MKTLRTLFRFISFGPIEHDFFFIRVYKEQFVQFVNAFLRRVELKAEQTRIYKLVYSYFFRFKLF